MGAWVTNAEQRLGRDEIAQLLAQHGRPRWWSNGPGDTYAPHVHAYHKVLYCVTGTIIFHVDGEDHMLSSRPGEHMEFGHVLPPDGQERAWREALPDADRRWMNDLAA